MAITITRRQIREGAAKELGLFLTGACDAVNTTNHTINVSDMRTKLPDPYTVQDMWVTPREVDSTGNQFRRVVGYETPQTPNTLLLDGGPDGVSQGNSLGFYMLLSVAEWNDVVNEALGELWKTTRIEFNLEDNVNEYPIDEMTDDDSDLCTWVTSRTQIDGLDRRYAQSNTPTDIRGWDGVRYIENNNSLTVYFSYLPYRLNDQVTMRLIANKPYAWPGNTLDTDQDTTTCPYKLAEYAVMVKGMRLIFKKNGTAAMRDRFAATLAIAERELADQKRIWMRPLRNFDYQVEENYTPDIPEEMRQWSW